MDAREIMQVTGVLERGKEGSTVGLGVPSK